MRAAACQTWSTRRRGVWSVFVFLCVYCSLFTSRVRHAAALVAHTSTPEREQKWKKGVPGSFYISHARGPRNPLLPLFACPRRRGPDAGDGGARARTAGRGGFGLGPGLVSAPWAGAPVSAACPEAPCTCRDWSCLEACLHGMHAYRQPPSSCVAKSRHHGFDKARWPPSQIAFKLSKVLSLP